MWRFVAGPGGGVLLGSPADRSQREIRFPVLVVGCLLRLRLFLPCICWSLRPPDWTGSATCTPYPLLLSLVGFLRDSWAAWSFCWFLLFPQFLIFPIFDFNFFAPLSYQAGAPELPNHIYPHWLLRVKQFLLPVLDSC